MRNRHRYLLLILVAGGLILALWQGFLRERSPEIDPDAGAAATQGGAENRSAEIEVVAQLPPVATSRFVNTSGAAKFIGAAKCRSATRTSMRRICGRRTARALGAVDVQAEPGSETFINERSRRRYEVVRIGNQVRHRETLLGEDGQQLTLAEYPVQYTIGSGHHSRSYLVETDGFLLESPITWYASKQAWAVSPGYNVARPPGFERVADVGCVLCHAGRVEPVDGNRFRVKIHDQSISCESCHGPGSLHAARHQSDHETAEGEAAVEGEDLTIVNPAHLTRAESEAACAQCHLRGDASVVLRGRSVRDFRPGLRLNDFRADYVLEQPDTSMKVVGHVEQMRLSRCYQNSETFTCTTCHDPHAPPVAAQRVEHFRQKCLTCHAVEACGLEVEQRTARDQQDNCVACHMPQSPTDIPHFAFTHHRVGRHEPAETDGNASEGHSRSQEVGRLVPLHDLSHLPRLDQMRCLGLAYLELSDKQASPEAHDAYRQRARRLLEEVKQAGLRDGDVDSALARLHWEGNDLRRAVLLATDALKIQKTSGAHANALFVLGDSYLSLSQPARALPYLEELVQRRRQSEDWILLGVCLRSTGQLERAIVALERAAEISPNRIDARAMLAQLYQARGDQAAAARHRQAATLLNRELKRTSPRPQPGAGPQR